MTTEQMILLPHNLTAKFRYLCATKTIHGSLQAKCYYICNEQEYSGILFAPDGEEWFTQVPEGAMIKAHKISPCDIEPYLGEYKGQALPLDQQSPDIMWNPVKTETILIDMTNTPALLREAACMIEMLLALTNQAPAVEPKKETQKKLPYRSVDQWTDEIVKIIGANNTFQIKPFSALSFNGYLEHQFNDFWEGDLEMVKSGARWRTQTSSALRKLVECNFIECTAMKKHYKVTQHTLDQLNDPFSD
jgi:hypothetical protein